MRKISSFLLSLALFSLIILPANAYALGLDMFDNPSTHESSLLDKFITGAVAALLVGGIPIVYKVGKKKKAESIEKERVYYGVLGCRVIGFFVLGVICADTLLMLIFGSDSDIDGLTAIVFLFVMGLFFTAVFVSMYTKSFKKKFFRTNSSTDNIQSIPQDNYCKSCGCKVALEHKFCTNCGAKIEKIDTNFDKPVVLSEQNGVCPNAKKSRKRLLIFCVLLGGLCISVLFLNGSLVMNKTEKVKDSVVMIEAYDGNYELLSSGSGFCAFNENWIVTNFHVVEGARKIVAISDDRAEFEVKRVVLFNKKEDLAILEIDGNLLPLELGNGSNIKVKDNVTAIGSPLGELNTVSEGIISNADETKEIRISAPISHGSSGGVLLNRNHKVIGITSAGYDEGQNLNFAINVDVLKNMYSEFLKNKYAVITSASCGYFMPIITGFNTDNQLEILGKPDNGKYYNYTVSDLDTFYLTTNAYAIFDYRMRGLQSVSFSPNSFCDRYVEFSADEKKLAADYYTYLLQFEYRTENSPSYFGLRGNIPEWTEEEFIMELDIMRTFELAILMVDLDKLNDSETFTEYLNESSLGYESCILLHRLFFPTDNQYNNDIIEFFNGIESISYQQEKELLEYLGMEVDEEGYVHW